MINGEDIARQARMQRARTLTEARRNGRHVAQLYAHALEAYPTSAIFNTTDIRVLVHAIEDLIKPRRGAP